MPKRRHSTKIPSTMQEHYEAITDLTNSFCEKYLNNEYKQLVEYTAAALCRKKLSPVVSGRKNTWAAAIIHAVGTINFLFDKSNEPFVTADEIAQFFELSKSTIGNKAKSIRDLLKMTRFDHHWYLPSRLDSSMVWIITVNGFIVDARTLDINLQTMAYEKGLIPYIWAETGEVE